MSFRRTRIYYRNPFFHIGHLNTLVRNNNIAVENNGTCYAIIDDRLNAKRMRNIKDDLDYLGLHNIEAVSVAKHTDKIMKHTEKLVNEGYIYMYHCSTIETNPAKIISLLRNPKIHFQLKLSPTRSNRDPYTDPSVGYTKEYDYRLNVVLIFDYIIKILDTLLQITDIISTSTSDVTDIKDHAISSFFDKDMSIKYHRLNTYYIHGFKYSKKNWPMMNENDPYLLTIKGLKARHVPAEILHAFYFHATQMGSIKITFLSNLLRNYLYRKADRVSGVIRPVPLEITNWPERCTEYVCKSVNPLVKSDMVLTPMTHTVYIDRVDYGIDNSKLTKGRSCRLRYGPNIMCTDVVHDDRGPTKLTGKLLKSTHREKRCITWISSEWGQQPVKVLFYLYNWFYTGLNTLMKPQISTGFIEKSVFKDLSQIYQVERHGYYIYDQRLSQEHQLPTFICICKI